MLSAHGAAGMIMEEGWKELGTTLGTMDFLLLLHFRLSAQLTIWGPWIVFLASFPGDLLLSSAHRRSRKREGQGSPSLSYPLSSSSSGICHVRQLLWWPSSVPPAPGIGTSPLTSG